MTLLQQVCTDMVTSQDQLERLHSFERARCAGFKTLPGFVEDLHHIRVIHESELARCAYILQRHPAANDAVNLPGAA